METKVVLNSNNIIDEMLKKFPQLSKKYNELLNWYDNNFPGLHIIFGDIFNPYVLNLLEHDNNKNELNEIFNFIETMLHGDEIVQEVAVVTILERIGGNELNLKKSIKYMGSQTIFFSNLLESYVKNK